MIKVLDQSSVHQICSGQVIVDLSSAVKELVENALDAGSTCVEVKLKDMGGTSIEVSDNGKGIDPVDYPSIAMKHHTSKLETFEDLNCVSSFGFRGEALNALCELSENFSVSTKRPEDKVGTLLSFDNFGRLKGETMIGMETGTTITIENLFHTLPVRRQEFLRSIKKQYQKMIKLIQSYALISVGVKIIVTNSVKGAKQTVLAIPYGKKLEDNVSSLFGSKFSNSLIKFKFELDLNSNVEISNPEEDSKNVLTPDSYENFNNFQLGDSNENKDLSLTNEKNIDDDMDIPNELKISKMMSLEGLISKVGEGVGRSDNDRQFIFCNNRPVDLTKFTKVMNEIWRRYEMKQKPAFIINLIIPNGMCDVNMSPDKREILINNEETILNRLKQEIDVLYAPSRSTFRLSQCVTNSQQTNESSSKNDGSSTNSNFNTPISSQYSLNDFNFISSEKLLSQNLLDQDDSVSETCFINNNIGLQKDEEKDENIERSSGIAFSTLNDSDEVMKENSKKRNSPICWVTDSDNEKINELKITSKKQRFEKNEDSINEATIVLPDENWSLDLETVISGCKNKMKNKRRVKIERENKKETKDAEVEKDIRILKKEDFNQMRVLGQFNLGFIITELNGDLFILDQHACDEKYRFENLQRNTIIHQQPLITPLLIETSVSQELTIIENIEIFHQNGFNLEIRNNQPVGKRIFLLSVPFSKQIHFGLNDINELASMIEETNNYENNDEDGNNSTIKFDKKYLIHNNQPLKDNEKENKSDKNNLKLLRLPKLIAMFASRACRSAIMIGKSLNSSQMNSVVNKMVNIEQPWNCPHGRPTMRHLAIVPK